MARSWHISAERLVRGDAAGDPDLRLAELNWRETKQLMALSVVYYTALAGHVPSQPLFSHLPGFAVFGIGMLAGALAVLVSGWLRDHPQLGRRRPIVPVRGRFRPSAKVRGPALAPRLVPVPPTPAPAPPVEPQAGLRIGLLGALTVNGQAGALLPAQSQLIVALALHAGGLANRRLRVLLGADEAHPKPADSLRQLIARTRRALGRAPDGREWVEHLGQGLYALHPDAVVDWREFETLTGEGIARSDPAPLARALDMVRGEPFTGCYYWWLEPALTESVTARIVVAAEALAELNLAAGDSAGAIRTARIGLTAEPSAEQLWRILMRAEHAAGNLARVREAMDRCLSVVAEVAADGQPDSATLAVYGELLAR